MERHEIRCGCRRRLRPRDFRDQRGDFRLVRVADDVEDTGKSGQFFGGPLGVAAGGDDFSCGICGVKFANGVAGLRIRGRGDSASVDDDDVSTVRSGREIVALSTELALDRCGVGLCGAAAELFDVKRRHGCVNMIAGMRRRAKGRTRFERMRRSNRRALGQRSFVRGQLCRASIGTLECAKTKLPDEPKAGVHLTSIQTSL
jgi:hypothetical protein